MSMWRQATRGLRRLFRPRSVDAEIADEVRDYLDQATADHLAQGMSPDEAARAAGRELGSAAAVRDQVRDYGWENTLERMGADVRYAARSLRAAPGFCAVAVFTLALGLGGVTAVFSALQPILFAPLPYPDADRIAMVWETRPDGRRSDGTFGMFRWFSDRSEVFQQLAVFRPWQPTATGVADAERLTGQRVSAEYFRVLGVSPAAGRDFIASDDRPGDPNVVIVSDALWRRRFGGEAAIHGQFIALDDVRYMVIGVMPPGFVSALAPAAEVWAPMQYGMSQGRAWGHHLRTVGRLREGLAIDHASERVDASGHAAISELHPDTYRGEIRFVVTPLADDMVRDIKPTLLTIAGAMVLVLVIACVNVTNLLLARGVQRRGEFALRVALGAGRARLVRQLVVEGLLLAVAGGVTGMALALAGVRALVALGPPGLERADAIRLDDGVFIVGALISTVVGLLVGVIPGWQAARTDPQPELQHVSGRTTSSHWRARRALVVVQVALALVLLVGSGLLWRSLQRLFAVPTGFDPTNVLTMQIQTTGARLAGPEQSRAFFEGILDAVRQLPGVVSAGLTNQLPLSGDREEFGVHREAHSDQARSAFRYAVSPSYFGTMNIPVRIGRAFTAADQAATPFVAIVSESQARTFEGGPAIGQRLRIGPADGPLYEVVGVAADLRQMSLAGEEAAAIYTPMSQWPSGDRTMTLVVRADRHPLGLVPAIRERIRTVDPNQPILRIATMDGLMSASAGERRFALIAFEAPWGL